MRSGRKRHEEERDDSNFGILFHKMLKRRKGLTQEMVAYQSGIQPATLSRMRKGMKYNLRTTRMHLRALVLALCEFGVLYSLEEANRLIKQVPGMEELDRTNKDDLIVIDEIEKLTIMDTFMKADPFFPRLEDVAWSVYFELMSRIAIYPLAEKQGLLREVLNSLYALFVEVRRIFRDAGAHVAATGEEPFGWIGIELLNTGLRPFTTKWHPLLQDYENRRPVDKSAYEHEQEWEQANEMRQELAQLQRDLEIYAEKLARFAGVKHKKVDR